MYGSSEYVRNWWKRGIMKVTKWDRMCKGLGTRCVHCNNELPDDENSPRVCPDIGGGSDDEN